MNLCNETHKGNILFHLYYCSKVSLIVGQWSKITRHNTVKVKENWTKKRIVCCFLFLSGFQDNSNVSNYIVTFLNRVFFAGYLFISFHFIPFIHLLLHILCYLSFASVSWMVYEIDYLFDHYGYFPSSLWYFFLLFICIKLIAFRFVQLDAKHSKYYINFD